MLLAAVLAACSASPGAPAASNIALAEDQTDHYELTTGMADGKLVFIGVGGSIDKAVNPLLKANPGDTVEIKLTSGEGAEHNITFPDFNAESAHVSGAGNSITMSFKADRAGTFIYYCNLPGHRQAGMEGKLQVGDGSAASAAATPAPTMAGMDMTASQAPATGGADVARDPTDLPGPLSPGGPTTRRLDLEAKEVVGQLADGTTFTYWTFGGKVPGPFFRVRVGDTVEVHLKNDAASTMSHSVDFHAVTGPGGGAVGTQTAPGGETMFTFQALSPGLFVYHCATPMVAEHMANGMYGMILVEPEGGLSQVEREFYVMQGEIYTTGKFGMQGMQMPDTEKLLNETPEYYVFNGTTTALTTDHPLQAKTGQTVRIFFGVGGPNKISSFHIIGEILDRVYDQASLTSSPLTDVQTTLVPPGGATMVELKLEVPGRYLLVDHALARLQRGLAGYLVVEGDDAPEIFSATPMPGSGH
jgi:nitrite reductase (NO-forming)